MSVVYLEDLEIGQSARLQRRLTAADIEAFAAVTGDDNPIHLDEAYAKTTPFGGRIAHGMLSASLVSAVLGTQLPGPGAIYVSQTLQFRRPVRIDDEVAAEATVTAIDAQSRRVTLATVCRVGSKKVLEGEAVVIAPSRPG